MNSPIFTAFARLLAPSMLAASVLILLRGHDEPGGGFVGGLVAAMALGILALAEGVPEARRRLGLHPVALLGAGLALGLASGLPGLFLTGAFLDHQWLLFANGFKLGTTMVFDLGVYLVVFGGILGLILRLYEEDAP